MHQPTRPTEYNKSFQKEGTVYQWNWTDNSWGSLTEFLNTNKTIFFKLWDVEKNDPKLKCWITWFKMWQFRKIRFKNLKRCTISIWKTDTLQKFCFKLWFFLKNFAGEPCFFEKPKYFRSSTFNDVRRMKALFFTHFI